jgi:hypothetical protein
MSRGGAGHLREINLKLKYFNQMFKKVLDKIRVLGKIAGFRENFRKI